MCRRLVLILSFLAVAAAGCNGGGSSCVDDPAARHHAQHPLSGQCLEFASSCEIPDSWEDCVGGCTNACDPGSVRDELTCDCTPVCTTTCDPPFLLELATCACVEACGPLDCDPGYEPATDACACVPIEIAARCVNDDACEAWQFCDLTVPPAAGGGAPGEAPGAGDAPLLPAEGTCQANPGCTYDSECGVGRWCMGGWDDGTVGGVDGGSAPPSPGFAPVPDGGSGGGGEDRAACAPSDAGGDCGAPVAPGICTRGSRDDVTACFVSAECSAGDVCPAEAGYCGVTPSATPMSGLPDLPDGSKALVACMSSCMPACYGAGDCGLGYTCNIPASSGGLCLTPSFGSGGGGSGDVPAGGGGGAPAPPPCAGWCERSATPPTDPVPTPF